MRIRFLVWLAFSSMLVLGTSLVQKPHSVLAFAAPDVAQNKDAEQQVLKANEELFRAMQQVDLATLDRLYADDFTHIHAAGSVSNRAEILEQFKSRRHTFQSLDIDDATAHIYGNSATVVGHNHARDINNGKVNPEIEKAAFMTVWVLQQGQWRAVAYVASRIADRPAAAPGAAPGR